MPEPPRIELRDADEPPPFLGTWRRLYTAVVCYLLVLISLFYIFTVTFTPKR
jgi:hypothetical protein